jgi:NTE family protein
LTICACALATQSLRGQPAPDAAASAGPAIGLVLSGGGARGGAHIGALRALEELRIPIHYIAGTSIGAAIGGFYASGMSVEDIETFVGELDWEGAFFNNTPRQLRSFRRKRDDDLFLVNQRPGLNDGELDLPTAILQGQVIDAIMSRVTLPVAGVDDFDNLMIPFRAVAGDIATGEAVVLSSGQLSTAIRASMAIPAVLTPIELDGRTLVDGGIVMNLPVEVAQGMGADTIIAVNITSDLYGREELTSVVDITAQLTTLLTRFGVSDQLERLGPRDVVITPQFDSDFSSASFNRIAETIDRGYEAVMANREALMPFSLSEQAYAAYRAGLHDPREKSMPVIDFINVHNDSIIRDSIIRDRLSDIRIGEPLDVDAVERAIGRVYGLEYYQTVRYAVVEEDDQRGLEIDLNSRSWGPNYLQLGVEYSSAGDANAIFGLAASYLRTAINERGGEWRATFVVGDEPAFLASMYQPFGDSGRFFVAPSLDVSSRFVNVFDSGTLISQFALREADLELAGGRELGSWGEVRTGLRSGAGDTRLRIGDPLTFADVDYRRGEYFARFSVDTLDNIAFPSTGVLASAEWRHSTTTDLGPDARYEQISLSTGYAKSWGRHTLLTTMRYDATTSGVPTLDRVFRFGGFFDLSGLNRNELTGKYVARVGASYYRRIGDLALFPAFAGFSVEVGNAFERRSDITLDRSLIGGSLWAGVDTPVGPVYVAYGTAEGGDDAFYVFLGRIFR